jgi:3-isopropylmalate/(R)-2-methylmalate dehydratase small subunit
MKTVEYDKPAPTGSGIAHKRMGPDRMQKIEQVAGTGIPLVLDDIDTDRIIPARYLRCVSFDGLGEHAFEDDRQQDANHPFDAPQFADANVLIAGRNFGCGSSREHAPQALVRWGIKAIVAESFAEIFFGNCISLGIPAVCASRADLERVAAAIQATPDLNVSVDLTDSTVRFGDESIPCVMPDSVRTSLMSGQWDFLGQMLEAEEKIRETASKLPYINSFVSV